MQKKPWIPYALLFLFLSGAAGVVWLTYHPESSILERLTRWPAVGPWAKQLRAAYLHRPEAPTQEAQASVRQTQESPPPRIIYKTSSPPEELPSAGEGIAEEGRQDPQESTPQDLDAIREALLDARIERIRAREFRWFRPGVTVRQAPEPHAPEWLTLEAPQRFSFQEKRGDWARVRLGAFDGWIRVSAETLMATPPLGQASDAVKPVRGRKAEPHLLDQARQLLRSQTRSKVGGYPLLTDVDDEPFLRYLDATVRGVAKAHVRRYDLPTIFPAVATVILFREEAAYRTFQGTEDRLADLKPQGHHGQGVIALYRGDLSDAEVAGTLAHEVVHSINRRSVGPALPPWLDEGMAEDISLSLRRSDGRIDFTRLAGGVERIRAATYKSDLGYASLERMRRAVEADTLTPLEQLLEMDWPTFLRPGAEENNYAQSAFFLRFLKDDRRLAKHFRWYLEGIAKGNLLAPWTLQQELGKSWEELDAGFKEYLEMECRRYLEIRPEPEI